MQSLQGQVSTCMRRLMKGGFWGTMAGHVAPVKGAGGAHELHLCTAS